MPLTVPQLDTRTYQELVDEALARIPVHTPEWTNFNDSDPGVTLLQLSAFIAENMLYRSNQIPERNRRKFLTLLGVPLTPGQAARGLVTFDNATAPSTLPDQIEVFAEQVAFRTTLGLDVLPIETWVGYKRALLDAAPELTAYYQQLYASFGEPGVLPEPALYAVTALEPPNAALTQAGIDLANPEIVDGSLWIALLARSVPGVTPAELRTQARVALGGRTLNLGIVPMLSQADLTLAPSAGPTAQPDALLRYEMPAGTLTADRRPNYRSLDGHTSGDLLTEPVVVQLQLPPAEQIVTWENLEPLESGADDFPPPLEDSNVADRLISWLRIRLASNTLGMAGDGAVKLLWVGVNATTVSQRVRMVNERLPDGTGDPDQTVTLARGPVLADSIRLRVISNATPEIWQRVDDLLGAGPEVPVRDARLPPGTSAPKPLPAKVFALDAEGGTLRFGDGLRGARPPFGATLRADYDYSEGREGNVGIGAINKVGPGLPESVTVSNPVPSWGGADPETVAEGEKQVARYIRHRDRLVTVEDFVTITRRTPGVELGRVEVIPTFNPELAPNARGAAPGAVTIMVIPTRDLENPDAPTPDRLFLKTICDYLEPRRLVTSEIFLRKPIYIPIWISIGITVVPNQSIAVVREAVRRALRAFLSPLPSAGLQPMALDERTANGWPLNTPVIRLQLWAVASRVPGVLQVNDVLLDNDGPSLGSVEQVALSGLELPQVLAIGVTVGPPLGVEELRSQTIGTPNLDQTPPPGTRRLPVPIILEECH